MPMKNGALKHEQSTFTGKELLSNLKEQPEANHEEGALHTWDNFYGKLNDITVSNLSIIFSKFCL